MLFYFSGVLNYLNVVWLDKFKERFVSVWTDKVLNFGNHTTNRVESQHSLLKLHLGSSHSNLDRFVNFIDHVIRNQYASIKDSLERSRIFINPKHNTYMFKHLLGVISIAALDLIFKELKRSNGLELTNENCGCILRTSCGLPCACELATHFSGQYIPIESIDVFWRKLNLLSYTPMQDDDLTCDAELEKLKLTFQKQSKFGKTNIFKKIKGIYDATTSFVLEPAVQKNTRGRPNSKDTHKKIDPVKPTTFNPPTQEPPSCSSYVDPEPPTYDSYVNPELPMYSPYVSEPPTYDSYVNPEPPRYSSYVDPEPPRFSSYVPEPPTYDSYVDPEPPMFRSYVDLDSFCMDPEPPRYLDPLISEIPAIYQPYVRQIHNVLGDGNCGFRVVATCLGLDENAWPRIRRDLLDEIELHQEGYADLFGSAVLNNIKRSIDHFKQGFAPNDRWMHMPDTGAIIASCYNVIVHFLSPKGSSAWLPLWSSPPENPQNVTWVIAHVNNNHYVKVDLQGNYPLPIIYQCWSRYKQDCAAMWEILYTLRI